MSAKEQKREKKCQMVAQDSLATLIAAMAAIVGHAYWFIVGAIGGDCESGLGLMMTHPSYSWPPTFMPTIANNTPINKTADRIPNTTINHPAHRIPSALQTHNNRPLMQK